MVVYKPGDKHGEGLGEVDEGQAKLLAKISMNIKTQSCWLSPHCYDGLFWTWQCLFDFDNALSYMIWQP